MFVQQVSVYNYFEVSFSNNSYVDIKLTTKILRLKLNN